jgi:hypothetical protein
VILWILLFGIPEVTIMILISTRGEAAMVFPFPVVFVDLKNFPLGLCSGKSRDFFDGHQSP